MPDLILASASPRRRELLAGLGLAFTQEPAAIPEVRGSGESAEEFVQRLALEKARSVAAGHPGAVVLGSDTEVILNDEPLGKPVDGADAAAMLQRLSGREHTVLTAVALVQGDREATRLVRTKVHFRSLSAAEIQAYWETGEPADKAGAYGIQGLGAVFVERLDGSYSGVVGLPLFETAELLKEFEIAVLATG